MNEATLRTGEQYLGWEGCVVAREAAGGRRREGEQAGDARISVSGSGGNVIAQRALSCLVEPQVGDSVLVGSRGSRSYILAVLERTSSQPVELAVDQDLVLRSRSGSVEVKARRFGLEAGETEVRTGQLGLSAARAEVFTQVLSWLGSKAQIDVSRIQTVAQVAESVIDRVSQTFGRVYRKVEDFEQVKAGRIDYQADLMNLRGKNTMLTAEGLVKVDANQVHLG